MEIIKFTVISRVDVETGDNSYSKHFIYKQNGV